jgi:ABC-2 type transport system permease protein
MCLLALTAMTFALCRSDQQLMALTNVATMVFAGLGGALVPVATLPGWARAISPLTPGYWAMTGFRRVTLDGAGIPGVAKDAAVLLGFAVLFAAVAAFRLRANDRKGSHGY